MNGVAGGRPAGRNLGLAPIAGNDRLAAQRGPATGLVMLADLLPRPRSDAEPALGINGLADDPPTAAMLALTARERGAWVGRGRAAEPAPAATGFHRLDLDVRDVHAFDAGQSRATIWPLYHDLSRPAQYDHQWRRAYHAVNRAYALAAATEAGRGATVWVHDYKLQLVPGMLRRLRPDLLIGLHLQTPFPAPDLLRQMPMHADILVGLLGADLLGFQTANAAENFLRFAHNITDTPPGVVVLPTSVDTPSIFGRASSSDITARVIELRRRLGSPRTVILSVSTPEHADSVERRLLGLANMFRTQRLVPADVAIVQLLLGSSADMDERTADGIARATAHINGQYAAVGRPCLHYIVANPDLAERVTLYQAADVLLATPMREGATLPALEFAAAARSNAGLVLSEFSGTATVLPDAYLVNPNDDDAVQDGILAALAAKPHERARRLQPMRDYVASYDTHTRARGFLAALRAKKPRPWPVMPQRGPHSRIQPPSHPRHCAPRSTR